MTENKNVQMDLTESYQKRPPLQFNCELSLGDRVKDLAEENPDLTAFVFRAPRKPRSVLTRKQFYDRARAFGSALIKIGVKTGDKIAVLATLGANWVIVQFGIYMTGATAVNSTAFDEKELRKLAIKFGCSGTIYDSDHGSEYDITFTFLGDNETKDVSHDLSKSLVSQVTIQGDVKFPVVLPSSAAFLCFTSGSTGKPKAVIQTHRALLSGYVGFSDLLGVSTEDLIAIDRPMVWSGGYPYFYIGAGIPMLYVTNPDDTDENDEFYVDVLNEEKATQAMILDYRIKGLRTKPHLKAKLPRLTSSMIGGQMTSKKSVEFLLEVSESVKIVYGTTECNDKLVHVVKDTSDLEDGIAGYIPAGCEIKLTCDTGNIVPVGQKGELCFRGLSCLSDYIFSDGSRGSIIDKDGWYHTGDIAVFRKDGLVRILGRTTEIIKRATVKILPVFVEGKLKEITDVQDVVVVGIPDERLFEEVCAFIILKPKSLLTVKDIKQKATELFRPTSSLDGLGLMPGHFFIVDDYPRTSVSSKPNKTVLVKKAFELINTL